MRIVISFPHRNTIIANANGRPHGLHETEQTPVIGCKFEQFRRSEQFSRQADNKSENYPKKYQRFLEQICHAVKGA
jgi:hypothetical protein